jgi:hypothetical protein
VYFDSQRLMCISLIVTLLCVDLQVVCCVLRQSAPHVCQFSSMGGKGGSRAAGQLDSESKRSKQSKRS